jgi:tetratricopeptide (TPR) repeat protein
LLLGVALLAGAGTAGTCVLSWRQFNPRSHSAPLPPATVPSAAATPEPQAGSAGDMPGTAESLYADALAAQQRGDALACTQLVDAAMRAGGSALYYRTEGECYESLGDRLNALKAYERFCAAAPSTDPARARVQELVRAGHGRCE